MIRITLVLCLLVVSASCLSKGLPWGLLFSREVDPYENYKATITDDTIRTKISAALHLQKSCTHLFDLDEQNRGLFLEGDRPLVDLIREYYPDPYYVHVSTTEIDLCWKTQEELATTAWFAIGFICFLVVFRKTVDYLAPSQK